MIELAAWQALASDYRQKSVMLSADSLALIFCINHYLDLWNWRGADDELTLSERDEIEAASAKLVKELSVMDFMIGMVVPTLAIDTQGRLLLCDGSTYAREDYPELYSVLQSNWIVDADNFRVPDLIGRVIVGTDDAMGDTGGAETHTLTIAETPPHTHEESGHSHIESSALASVGAAITGVPVPSAVPSVANTTLAFVNLSTVGGGAAHNNMQPYQKILYAVIAR